MIQILDKRDGKVLKEIDADSLRDVDLAREELSNADLKSFDLFRADLSHADLRDADLSFAYLYRADLRGANLGLAFLQGAILSRADLRGADLRDAFLTGADLSGANLAGAVLSVDIDPCDLRYAEVEGAFLEMDDGNKLELAALEVYGGLYEYTVCAFVDADGVSWVRMGCHVRPLHDWADSIATSNRFEYPDDGSPKSRRRIMAFEYAASRARVMAEEYLAAKRAREDASRQAPVATEA